MSLTFGVALLVHKRLLPFSENLEYGRANAVNNTIKRDTTTSDCVQFSGETITAAPSL
jgi:hypothetical protein